VSDLTAINVGLILLIASIVAMATRRMRLPYSVGLVAAGILLTLLPVKIGFSLSPDLIFTTLLPPLIFEGALQMRWSPFRR
jgi:CPA1 family monovalent cation:H+ antiporter